MYSSTRRSHDDRAIPRPGRHAAPARPADDAAVPAGPAGPAPARMRGPRRRGPGGARRRRRALLTDHYIPQVGSPRPTVLVRTPYGRGFPWDHLFGGLVAERGFHVVIQSCRGTGGSGGEFQPFRHEQADGLATVAWLREQDWFTGVLATIGPSYLSYVQWALAADPPPELRAMVSQNGVSDPYSFVWPGGAFALENVLVATAAMLSFERGMAALIRSGLRVQRRLRRVARQLPLIDAYPAALGTRVSHLDEWLQNPDRADPYWASLEIGADRPVPPVPASLLTGWWDACLDQVLERYRQLRDERDPGPPGRRPLDPLVRVQPGPRGRPGRGAQLAAGLHRRRSAPHPDPATKTSRCGCTSAARGNGVTWPTGHRRRRSASRGTWAPGAAWPPNRRSPGTRPAGGVLVPLRPGGSHTVGGRPAPHREGRGRGQPGPGGPPRRPGVHQCAADRGAGRDRPGQRAGPGPRLRPALRPVRPAVRRGPAGAFTQRV